MTSSHKNGKMLSSNSDAIYDREISRQAKETYQIFSKKVLEDSEECNARVNYPVHWLLTPIDEKANAKKVVVATEVDFVEPTMDMPSLSIDETAAPI